MREEEDPNDLLGQIEESLGIDTDALLSELEGLEDTYGDDLAEGLRALEEQLGTDAGSGLLDDLSESVEGRTDPAQVRRELRGLQSDLDDVVLAAVDAAFSPAFVLTGAMALLAALILLPRVRRSGIVGAAVLVAVAVPAGYAIAQERLQTEPVEIADPCKERERQSAGGWRACRGGGPRGRRPRGLPLWIFARGAGAGAVRLGFPAGLPGGVRRGRERA